MNDSLLQQNMQSFLVFTLVLTRVSGLLIAAPVLSAKEAPMQVRALFAFALALLLTPTQLGTKLDYPGSILNYLVFMGGEILIGLTLGLGVQLLFVAMQLAGQLISQLSGMSLADVFNPALETEIPLLSQFLYMLSVVIFLLIGGHRLLIAGLLSTFESMPLGGGPSPESTLGACTVLVSESLQLGLQVAAPTITAVLVATLILGLISRTIPQLNIMAIGFGINAFTTLGVLALSLSAVGMVFGERVEPYLAHLMELFAGTD